MMRVALFIISVAFTLLLSTVAEAARLKDLADIEGVRGNQLVGYGIVVGLQGTGDKKGALFTSQSVANMLERLGIRVGADDLSKLSNVAAVLVTAELPAFSRPGSKIDVTLSSLGDASTLQGGVLVMTPLKGADGKVYAVAQGPLSLGGFIVETATGDTTQKNHPTVARIPKGGTVERAIPYDMFASGNLRIVLRSPDFTTITRVQAAVNKVVGRNRARAVDSASVILPLDGELGAAPIHLIARLEELDIDPDVPARVVINERTGTIIMGEMVRVSTVALAHGNLNISIRSETQVSQPGVLAEAGETAIVENQDVSVGEEAGGLSVVNGTVSLGQVVDALNGLGATPRDLIAIFQALKEAGALQAELVIM
ncbi:MAG: flagellar basal body P-ring protein FlgI [Bdellovibrionales bacterium]|nr:flagellar basal body P-ring protein FlgI [Bdellovibrionales bacterium]